MHLIYEVLKTHRSFDANWATTDGEVVETTISVVVPVNINALALAFRDGIRPLLFFFHEEAGSRQTRSVNSQWDRKSPVACHKRRRANMVQSSSRTSVPVKSDTWART